MSDPFANLLTSFKNEGGSSKSSLHVASPQPVLQPLNQKKDSPSPRNLDITSKSGRSSLEATNSAIQDDFDELFGPKDGSNRRAGGQTYQTKQSEQLIVDDFDAAFVAFEKPMESDGSAVVKEEVVVDEVKDMEVAKLMSLDLTIEQATAYYDRGIMYEDLIKEKRKSNGLRSGGRERERGKSDPQFSKLFDNDNDSGNFFSMASGLLEKGRQLVDQFTAFPEEHDRRSDAYQGHRITIEDRNGVIPRNETSLRNKPEEPQDNRGTAVNDDLLCEFKENLTLEKENPPVVISRSPTPPQETLLDFDNDGSTISIVNTKSITPVPISQLEISGYNEYKDRGADFFRTGDYVSASQEYEKSLNSLPANHPLRVVAYSNLTASQFKNGEYKKCLSYLDTALMLFPQDVTLWNQTIQCSRPVRTYADMWPKIVTRRAEAFEHTEDYKAALETYQTLVEKNFFSEKVMDGKRRCQKALDPQKGKPTPKKPSPKPSKSTEVGSSSQNLYANVAKVKEENKKQKAEELEKAALYDKVFDQIEAWKGQKGNDLRYLLSNLSSVLTWCEWKPVSSSELVMPKKVKVVYMKAVARTHPDKIPTSLNLEKRMIAENVFSTLCLAWEKFKSENNIN